MASLSFIIGIIGNVISILVFTSPIKTFSLVVKKKSTENYKGDPYITTLLSTSLWTFYGLLKPGGLLVVTVNGAGAVMQLVYVTLFLIYAPKDKKVKMTKLVAILNVGLLGSAIAITLLAIHGDTRLTFVGIICAALTIGMYASPLSAMRTVIKTKSVKYMPFLLSFFLFLNAGIWSAYAVLVKDLYIGVPNATGFLLGSVQIILYSIYKNKSAEYEESSEEEGSMHLVKGNIGMGEYEDKTKNRTLSKGNSLPKPSLNRQYSVRNIMKTLSLTPYELHSGWSVEAAGDVESGGRNGNITTGLVYLAPVKMFWHIVKGKSTGEFESIPYVFKLLNAYFWTHYGLVKPNSVVVATLNGFGVVLEIIFVAIFYNLCSS